MSWTNLYLPFLIDNDNDNELHDYSHLDSQSIHLPSISPTSVKIEPDDPDSRFIMELAAYSSSSSPDLPDSYVAYNDSYSSVPPTEVPLRATQASKEMRRMMGVFRLNPFAMHTLSRGVDTDDSPDGSPTGTTTWCGEAGPLEQEPVMFEFQLDIDRQEDDGPVRHAAQPSSRLPAISAHDESQLRAFSPTFELHEGDRSESHEVTSPGTYNIQSDVGEHHAVSEEDPGTEFRQGQREPWEDADYAPQAGSDSGTSSSTTISVQTPLNESSCSPFDNAISTQTQVQHHLTGGCTEQTQISPSAEFSSTVPLWDVSEVDDNYQVQEDPGAGHTVNHGYTDIPHRRGIVHSSESFTLFKNSPNDATIDTENSYMRMTYQPPLYTRRPYAPLNAQFQQEQGQTAYFLNMSASQSSSLLHDPRRPSVQESLPSQEIEHVSQSPSTLSPVTPNSLQYPFTQQYSRYRHPTPSQHQPQHPQMPVYTSNPVTPTSMPLRLPISVAHSAMRSAAAFSNPGSSPSSPYSSGRGYRVSRRPHLEERIGEHEVYSTPHSPVSEERMEGNVLSTSVVGSFLSSSTRSLIEFFLFWIISDIEHGTSSATQQHLCWSRTAICDRSNG